MHTHATFLYVLLAVIVVLSVVIVVLWWQIRRHHKLLKQRREVIEREKREAEALLKMREQGLDDGLPTFREIEREVEHPQLTIQFNS